MSISKRPFTILEAFSKKPNLRALFESKIDRSFHPKGCWLWTGCISNFSINDNNAPSFRYGIVLEGVHYKFPVARIAWSLANNTEFPEGFHACHTCDNRRCVNPDHVWVGTDKQNKRDFSIKGGTRKGKGTIDERLHCAEEFIKGTMTKKQCIDYLNVSCHTVITSIFKSPIMVRRYGMTVEQYKEKLIREKSELSQGNDSNEPAKPVRSRSVSHPMQGTTKQHRTK